MRTLSDEIVIFPGWAPDYAHSKVAFMDCEGGVSSLPLDRGGDDPHLPDLSDAGTVGCLVALVRQVLGDEHFSIGHQEMELATSEGWCWDWRGPTFETEVEAWLMALEDPMSTLSRLR